MVREMSQKKNTNKRASYAHSNSAVRKTKAGKIIALLNSHQVTINGANTLEIGTGSGVIAGELSEAVKPNGHITSVDVVDERKIKEGYTFQQVQNTELPFSSNSFDLVISNHVIEHVGNRSAQIHHLQEIKRVLTEGGTAYLAQPNKWALTEPHFALPLLSWLPAAIADQYVRITKKGSRYDCNPQSQTAMQEMLSLAGLESEDITKEALQIMLNSNEFGKFTKLISYFGDFGFRLFKPIIPTYILLLKSS